MSNESDKIEKIHGEVSLLRIDGILCDMDAEKLEVMKNDISRNTYKGIIDFNVSCKK